MFYHCYLYSVPIRPTIAGGKRENNGEPLTNTSRNLAIKLNAYLPKEDTKTEIFTESYCPLPTSFILFLRSDYSTFMLDDIQHPELNFDSKHGPNQVASLLYNNVNQLYKDKIITDAQFININQDITDLTNICGACERIKIRQSLYSYSSFIKNSSFSTLLHFLSVLYFLWAIL